MGRTWVYQLKGPVFDSRLIAVVSGRASDLKCLHVCATLLYKFVDQYCYFEVKIQTTTRFLTEYHRVRGLEINVTEPVPYLCRVLEISL